MRYGLSGTRRFVVSTHRDDSLVRGPSAGHSSDDNLSEWYSTFMNGYSLMLSQWQHFPEIVILSDELESTLTLNFRYQAMKSVYYAASQSSLIQAKATNYCDMFCVTGMGDISWASTELLWDGIFIYLLLWKEIIRGRKILVSDLMIPLFVGQAKDFFFHHNLPWTREHCARFGTKHRCKLHLNYFSGSVSVDVFICSYFHSISEWSSFAICEFYSITI